MSQATCHNLTWLFATVQVMVVVVVILVSSAMLYIFFCMILCNRSLDIVI